MKSLQNNSHTNSYIIPHLINFFTVTPVITGPPPIIVPLRIVLFLQRFYIYSALYIFQLDQSRPATATNLHSVTSTIVFLF